MKRYVYILTTTAFVVALVLTSASLVGATMASPAVGVQPTTLAQSKPSATKKRIAITVTPSTETFQLSLISPGSVVRDAGKVGWITTAERVFTRDGQRVRVWAGTGHFVGTRGAIGMRLRWEWLNAGREHEAGVATWTVTTSTGSYAGMKGTGKGAAVWLPGRPVASRLDGFVRQS